MHFRESDYGLPVSVVPIRKLKAQEVMLGLGAYGSGSDSDEENVSIAVPPTAPLVAYDVESPTAFSSKLNTPTSTIKESAKHKGQ
jgi:hypothetical protein